MPALQLPPQDRKRLYFPSSPVDEFLTRPVVFIYVEREYYTFLSDGQGYSFGELVSLIESCIPEESVIMSFEVESDLEKTCVFPNLIPKD